MAPHSMETILQPPQWPAGLSNFVTWCLMWDPRNRPTSAQAMAHDYFADAIDPLRPKSSTSRLLGRKHSNYDTRTSSVSSESPALSSKPSWFRKSLIARESAPAVPQPTGNTLITLPHPSPNHHNTLPDMTQSKPRPYANKRATWANGTTPSIGAPMPILPSIRPISPLSDAVTAQANNSLSGHSSAQATTIGINQENSNKKIGRQLSVASNGNHYADIHRQEAERTLNGHSGLTSPSSGKESFFSHLRKRARRLSGRNQVPLSPKYDDLEANAGCGPWTSNRSSMALDPAAMADPASRGDFAELDRALQNVQYSLDAASPSAITREKSPLPRQIQSTNPSGTALKRQHSVQQTPAPRATENVQPVANAPAPVSTRTRRSHQISSYQVHRYETPDEEEELLDEALHSAQRAVKGIDRNHRADSDISRNVLANKDMNRQPSQRDIKADSYLNPYPTPSPSAKRNGILFSQSLMDEPATPLNITRTRPKEEERPAWPTPPYEENEWAASAAASIFAAGSVYQ